MDLIAAWREGSEAAATELVRRHAAAVARFLSAAGAGDNVDDLVQEAFFRAFRNLDGFRGGASFRTWVMTIASNALKDERRRAKRRLVVPIGDREFRDQSGGPAEQLDAADAESRVAAAVQELPRLQRDVFLLRAQQGLGYAEIAEALGTTAGAARVHYHHAVRRLKQALE